MKDKERDTKDVSDEGSKQTRGPSTPGTIYFHIGGMSCPSCARKIEKALSGQSGVLKTRVDFDRREARVDFDPAEAGPDDLKAAVKAVGYRLLDAEADSQENVKRSFWRLAGVRPYLIGPAVAMGVVGFYLGLLTLTSDWYNARLEFKEYGIWILTLAAGLGFQVILFSLLRAWHQGASMKAAKCSLAASGGMSTTAMAACCAHYLTIILPVLGLPFLSAAAAGLARYQTYFFMAGVLSNLFGIGLMLRMMTRRGMIQFRTLVNHMPFGLQRIRL
jgi:cation transport ATPase